MNELPTKSEINPISDDLDGRTAVEHFLGRSVDEAVDMLRENGLLYQEDLMFMGPRAFAYYLPALQTVLEEAPDEDLVRCVPSVLAFQFEQHGDTLADVLPVMRALCQFVIDLDDAQADPEARAHCRALLGRIGGSSAAGDGR